MANVLSTQVIYNGPRNLVIKCANLSDGTAETLVKKVDATSTTYANRGQVPGTHLKISRLEYSIEGGSVALYWEATTNDLIAVLGQAGTLDLDEPYQIPNSLAAGATGSILLSTIGFAANAGYTIIFHCTKNASP